MTDTLPEYATTRDIAEVTKTNLPVVQYWIRTLHILPAYRTGVVSFYDTTSQKIIIDAIDKAGGIRLGRPRKYVGAKRVQVRFPKDEAVDKCLDHNERLINILKMYVSWAESFVIRIDALETALAKAK